jgi:hypothetical protein
MMGGVRGQAWPAPIGQGDVAKYSALDVIVLILFPFTPCGQKERKREGKERERGRERMEGMSGQSKAPGDDAVQRLRRRRVGLLAVFSRERRRREGRWREAGKSREQGEKGGSRTVRRRPRASRLLESPAPLFPLSQTRPRRQHQRLSLSLFLSPIEAPPPSHP